MSNSCTSDLLDPLRRRMMRRVGAAGNVVAEKRLAGIDLVELIQPIDGIVRHGRGQVPFRIAHVGIDRRGVAEKVWLPLAGVAARRTRRNTRSPCRWATGRTARPGSPRRPAYCDPCRTTRCCSRVLENLADGGRIFRDDAVVARKARGLFRDYAEAHRMMIAAGDEGCPRRRAERGGVELRVAQSRFRDADPERASG